jgi:hypothetical protein
MTIPVHPKGIKKGRRASLRLDQTFSHYISFSVQATAFAGCFLLIYALVMLSLSSMLHASDSNTHHTGPYQGIQVPGQKRIAEAASILRGRLRNMRNGTGFMDASLLNETIRLFDVMRAKKRAELNLPVNFFAENNSSDVNAHVRPGVVVLGMHRSGTSMLSGLLVTSAGYKVGGPLIGAAFDNAKGFFERVDVVLQNDEFFTLQGMYWGANVLGYNWEQALKDKESGAATFRQGERGLQFLNSPDNSPWLQKDPRMCITLKTWMKLLNKEPAIVFTYRHPLEVAMSLQKREEMFELEHGLRIWIIYNMRGVQNSVDLCRVLSSNEAILADPLNEVQRIADELTAKCNVQAPPNRITQEDIDQFIDPDLQHNKKQREKQALELRVLDEQNDGSCVIRDYSSKFLDGTPKKTKEMEMYLVAMRIYCDLKSGKAYEIDYVWPDLK